jgi:hypothetical protein
MHHDAVCGQVISALNNLMSRCRNAVQLCEWNFSTAWIALEYALCLCNTLSKTRRDSDTRCVPRSGSVVDKVVARWLSSYAIFFLNPAFNTHTVHLCAAHGFSADTYLQYTWQMQVMYKAASVYSDDTSWSCYDQCNACFLVHRWIPITSWLERSTKEVLCDE